MKKFFKNLFKKEIIIMPNGCKVYFINDDTDILNEMLGITNERAEELHQHLIQYSEHLNSINPNSPSNVGELFVKAGELAEHPNELAFLASLLGHRFIVPVIKQA